jgi:hypothetical protein
VTYRLAPVMTKSTSREPHFELAADAVNHFTTCSALHRLLDAHPSGRLILINGACHAQSEPMEQGRDEGRA